MTTKRLIIQTVVTQDIKDWIAEERAKVGLSESAYVQLLLRRIKAQMKPSIHTTNVSYDPATGKLNHIL